MSEPYGMHVEFTAKPGRAEELEAMLLEAAAALGDVRDCSIYLVSRAADRPETVCVTEAWSSQEAHHRSLQDPANRALIERARALIAAPPQATVLRPAGGKGVSS
ncbi:MAG: putative quinol monooxygenase [Solirubrobacteraceae bacterium]